MKPNLLPVACLLAPALAVAGDAFTELEPVVVTAARVAETQDQALASVTVITREDLERRQAGSVAEALRGVPGIGVANTGGPGKPTSVFLRGAESRHVLVLVDGVRIGSATLGLPAWQDLPVEQIERIEIVRGPHSSLYGSDAIGGVIQIFTRGRAPGLSSHARATLGSFRTREIGAGVAYGGPAFWYRVGVDVAETDGIDACNGPVATRDFVACFADDPDRDGYRHRSLNLRGGYRLGPGAEIELSLLRAEGENDFDGTFQNRSETLQQVLGTLLRAETGERVDWTLRLNRAEDRSDDFLGETFVSRFDTRRDSGGVQVDLPLAGVFLTAGVDHEREKVSGTTAYERSSRSNTGVFGQLRGGGRAFDWRTSLRHDDNQQFGGETTGSLGLGWVLNPSWRATVGVGSGFKVPTFNDLYFPGFGNPDLGPERSRSAEAGLRWTGLDAQVGATVFENRIRDLIAFDAASMAPANVNRARIRGIEFDAGTRIAGTDLSASLTLQEPENRSDGANRGNDLPRRAQAILGLDVDRDFGRVRLGASLYAEGRRYDDLANTRRMSGYLTADLRAEYRLAPDWRLQARVENLFDRDYETAYGYNQPGRAGYLTLRYEPGY